VAECIVGEQQCSGSDLYECKTIYDPISGAEFTGWVLIEENSSQCVEPEPTPQLVVCPYCGLTVSESEYQWHLDSVHPPYDYPFTVSVTNTTTQGGLPVAATMEVLIGARLGGVDQAGWLSDESFGPGETKTLEFDITIVRDYFGQLMTIDAIVSSPDNIVGAESKGVVV